VQRLSADGPIDMLASDPDRFFGRTTKVGGRQLADTVGAGKGFGVRGGPPAGRLDTAGNPLGPVFHPPCVGSLCSPTLLAPCPATPFASTQVLDVQVAGTLQATTERRGGGTSPGL